MHGLGQDFELMSLGAGALQQIGGGGLAGEQQDLAGRQKAANMDGGFDAVHVGHDDVADHQVGTDVARALDGSGSGVDGGSIEAMLVKDDSQRVGNHVFVIDDQDL